ncbi:MAG: ImmA/IrrE family metallo-endopeptidase [Pyrinomonadaceae bacterium]
MNAPAYYEDLKKLAREVRAQNGLDTPRVLRRDLRKIYSKCGISIDLWPYRLRNLRGAFFSDDLGMTVMLAKGLPEDPMVFTMAHELKHYYRDRELGLSYCDLSNDQKPLEVGAEVFASEFLFPDGDFIKHMQQMGITCGLCTPETLVRLKHETRTTLSYAGLSIKAERLRFAASDSVTTFNGWRKLEDQMYGVPFYRK